MNSFRRFIALITIAGAMTAGALLMTCPIVSCASNMKPARLRNANTIHRSALRKAVIDVGPIDIHRKYLSMQGPLALETFTVGDLVAQQTTIVPESRIKYIENGSNTSTMSSGSSTTCKLSRTRKALSSSTAEHRVAPSSSSAPQPRQLFWYRGVQVETVDEKGRVMPTQEFMCHVCMMTFPEQHNKLFPYGKGFSRSGCRLANVTQGQKGIMLPEGFGIPFASDEKICIGLQAANRNTNQHRRIKIRLNLYFAKDQELDKPLEALTTAATSISVITKKAMAMEGNNSHCSACVESSMGEDAPNDLRKMFTHTTAQGEVRSAHWVVPPGVHAYREAITANVSPGFASNGPIRAAQLHAHPYCTSFSLLEFKRHQKRVMFTIHCRTRTSPVLEITHIDPFSSIHGILMDKDAEYAQEVVYDNTARKPIDAMATSVIYFSDPSFRMPEWAQRRVSNSL